MRRVARPDDRAPVAVLDDDAAAASLWREVTAPRYWLDGWAGDRQATRLAAARLRRLVVRVEAGDPDPSVAGVLVAGWRGLLVGAGAVRR